MQIRRFSPDLKTKIPGSHRGLFGTAIGSTNGNASDGAFNNLMLWAL